MREKVQMVRYKCRIMRNKLRIAREVERFRLTITSYNLQMWKKVWIDINVKSLGKVWIDINVKSLGKVWIVRHKQLWGNKISQTINISCNYLFNIFILWQKWTYLFDYTQPFSSQGETRPHTLLIGWRFLTHFTAVVCLWTEKLIALHLVRIRCNINSVLIKTIKIIKIGYFVVNF